MTIFQIESFYVLSQTLNFTQAAAKQFISQPAMSKNISSLEKELNVTLVKRSTHGVSLTPAGEAFVDTCRSILETYQTGIRQVTMVAEEVVGTVRLGVPFDSFEPIASKIVQELRRLHSGVQVQLKFFTASSLIQNLDNGRLDVIVASGIPKDPNTKYLLFERRPLYAVLPSNHLLAKRESILFRELRNEPFVVVSRTASAAGYNSIFSLAQDANFDPNIVSAAETVSELLTKVACGMGVTILYRDHQPYNSEECITFVPVLDAPPYNRYLIWTQNDNPCIREVIRIASEMYKDQT